MTNVTFEMKKKELIKLYCEKQLSSVKIAKLYNTYHVKILRLMKKFKIPRRTPSESHRGKLNGMYGKIGVFRGKKHTDKTKVKIGKANSGKNNGMYGKKMPLKSRIKESLSKGGTGIPYENNKYPVEFFQIRLKILKRDNYICQKCFEYGNEVHHIDYNKDNNKEDNLICLCHRCNCKVNKNRKYWKEYFKKE